jgi:hypothetical protein
VKVGDIERMRIPVTSGKKVARRTNQGEIGGRFRYAVPELAPCAANQSQWHSKEKVFRKEE